MNYCPAISPNDTNAEWNYLVQAVPTEEPETINEFKIELLSLDKVRAVVESEINFYKSQIAALEERLICAGVQNNVRP